MENIVLKNGKTINELKELPTSKIIQYVRHINDNDIRNYMCEWLYINHYSKIELIGNLTTRIRKINSNICLNFITNVCFSGYDFEKNKDIINLDKTKLIHVSNIHKIYPVINGIFWKAVIQRIINENSKDITLLDFDTIKKCENNINHNNQWQFRYKIDNENIEYWNMYSSMSLDSEIINVISHGNIFTELNRINEWMEIKYKNIIGFVRYLIPNDSYDKTDLNNYKFNDCFYNVEPKNYHTCYDDECDYKINSVSIHGLRICHVNICRKLCFEKVRDVRAYKTKDILIEILINSLEELERFNRCPNENKLNKIIEYLVNPLNNFESIINYISEIFSKYVKQSSQVSMNYSLGDCNIVADCDIIIDDELIDIKCTKCTNTNNNNELLQLLGYVALAKDKKIMIKKITIIHLVEGIIKSFNITDIQSHCFDKYYNILTNAFQ